MQIRQPGESGDLGDLVRAVAGELKRQLEMQSTRAATVVADGCAWIQPASELLRLICHEHARV